MQRSTFLLALAIALVLAPRAIIRAQNGPGPNASDVPRAKPAGDAIIEMKAALRQLAAAEETYWTTHGTYTTDLAALKLMSHGGEAWFQVRAAGGSGWSGRAAHHALPGKSCVIFYGDYKDVPTPSVTKADGLRPERDGEIVCDRP